MDNDEEREIHRSNRRANLASQKGSRGAAKLFQGDENQLRDFFKFFHPLLLDQARIMGVDADQRDETVTTFLDDKIIELTAMEMPPSSLIGYVVRGFRNRVRNLVRDRNTRMRIYTEAAVDVGASTQLLVAECHSDYSTNAARGQSEGTIQNDMLNRLAHFIQGELSAEDAELLIESARRTPLREIAEWHEISYAACRTRLHRLRSRTHQLTRDFVRNLSVTERTTIEKFLRRAGALEE
jgi:hypothetical protein